MSYTYSAFISYRHLPADSAAARAVQRALETYRIPREIRKKTGVKKLRRCFRDQDELPLADDLGSSIEKALQESEWLIVICSPDLPESRWCMREVDYFISLGRRDHIIPVLVSGEPKDSYPPRITQADDALGTEETEPLAADLRGSMRKQLKTEKLRIAARMLNLNYNDLKKRERERALRRGLAVVSCVLAVMVCFAGYAIYKNRLLTKERNATARNATELLLEKSVRSTAEHEIGSGLTYALQAYEGSRLFAQEYDPAVSAALEAAMYPETYSQIGTVKDNGVLHHSAVLSNDGKLILCRQSDFSVQVYSAVTGERLYMLRNFGWYSRAGLTPDSRYLFRMEDDDITVCLYSSRDGQEVLREAVPDGWTVSCMGVTADNHVPVRSGDGAAALFDPFTKQLTILEEITLPGSGKDQVSLNRSGRCGMWADGTNVWLVDTETGKVLRTLESAPGEFSRDGLYFRYRNGEEYVYLRSDTLEEACRSSAAGVLSPGGKYLAVPAGYEGFYLRDAQTGNLIWENRTGHNSGNTLYDLAFADDDTLIACHEEVQIFRISDGRVVYDSGEDRTTYGYDIAAGRLVMPLRSGGCLVNLMPVEEDILPHMTVETRMDYGEEKLAGTTACYPLAGNWDGMTFGFFSDDGWITVERDEPGVVYIHDNQEFVLHPVNGVQTPLIYVSPDNSWQAMIRGEEIDIFRAKEGPEPVLTIPGNGYDRLCAAVCGDVLAVGAYVENLALYDLNTGDCLGTVVTGAMCQGIQFSPDGKHIIALSLMAERATVANTENFAVVLQIPLSAVYGQLSVGFSEDGTEAAVIYPDGHADVGLMYQDLDTLVDKARRYTSEGVR